jgi:hypothetical protein
MKYLIVLILGFFASALSVEAKWTVLDSTNSSLGKVDCFTDGIVFDDLGGYYFPGFNGNDRTYDIYFSKDRGFSWSISLKIDCSIDTIKDQLFTNFISGSYINMYLTNSYLYVLFDCADEKINKKSGKYAYHKINDSTLTKNAVIMKLDRSTNEYEMFDTKILDRIKGFSIVDDRFGIVVGHRSIYRTEDGCQSFQKIFNTDSTPNWYFIDGTSPTKDDYFLLFSNDKRQCKLCFTNNAGKSWNFNTVPDSTLYIKSTCSSNVFLVNRRQYRHRLLYSDDNYKTFVNMLDTLVRDGGLKGGLCIKDSVVIVTNNFTKNIFMSFNYGKTWMDGDSIAYIGNPAGQLIQDCAIVDSKTIAFIDWKGARLFIYEKNKPVNVRALPDISNIVSIYPNPLPRSTPLNISLKESGLLTEFNFKIININGKTIDEFSPGSAINKMNIQYLPKDDLPSGTYFLVVESRGNVIATAKFVKM